MSRSRVPNTVQRQGRPQTDYERWLIDQDHRYESTDTPQYQPERLDISIDDTPRHTQIPITTQGSSPKEDPGLEQDDQFQQSPHHGHFLPGPSVQKAAFSPGIALSTIGQASYIDTTRAACRLSLSVLAIVLIIKAIRTMRKRWTRRRVISLPFTENDVVTERKYLL